MIELNDSSTAVSKTAEVKTLLIKNDEFWEQYKPLKNQHNSNSSWDGCMLETYGKELDQARAADQDKVWTVLETDDGDLGVSSGYHRVNRVGYIVTENPSKNGCTDVIDEPFKFLKQLKKEGRLNTINRDYELSDGMKSELEQAKARWSRASKPNKTQ